MTKHLERDMEHLYREMLAMSGLVEEMIDKATRALWDRSFDLAAEVIAADEQVDHAEVRIEEECLKMLALHQPVAIDLRRIATVLKVNIDLERIADLTVNLCERAQGVHERPGFEIPPLLRKMVVLATQMVRDSLDAFVNMDSEAARQICLLDDEVDRFNDQVIAELFEIMRRRPDYIEPAMHCFSATRHIERVADHATNIAEDVVYLVEGEIVRHRKELTASPQDRNGHNL